MTPALHISIGIAAFLAAVILLAWLGLQVKPAPFPPFRERTPAQLETLPLPGGLPAPVERFYRAVYGKRVPVIRTAVLTGRAVLKPVGNIAMPARFVFVHNAGKDYRHYIEATWFGLPVLKVNEGILDHQSFFESPMGSYQNDPNTNQGANLALWAEAGWFPSILVTDPRVEWQPVDDNTARLVVPAPVQRESFLVRFNPQTSLIDTMEAMRYRSPADTQKILWITRNIPGKKIPGTRLDATGSATWTDQGQPWAIFTLEDAAYNVDVSTYIRQRGF